MNSDSFMREMNRFHMDPNWSYPSAKPSEAATLAYNQELSRHQSSSLAKGRFSPRSAPPPASSYAGLPPSNNQFGSSFASGADPRPSSQHLSPRMYLNHPSSGAAHPPASLYSNSAPGASQHQHHHAVSGHSHPGAAPEGYPRAPAPNAYTSMYPNGPHSSLSTFAVGNHHPGPFVHTAAALEEELFHASAARRSRDAAAQHAGAESMDHLWRDAMTPSGAMESSWPMSSSGRPGGADEWASWGRSPRSLWSSSTPMPTNHGSWDAASPAYYPGTQMSSPPGMFGGAQGNPAAHHVSDLWGLREPSYAPTSVHQHHRDEHQRGGSVHGPFWPSASGGGGGTGGGGDDRMHRAPSGAPHHAMGGGTAPPNHAGPHHGGPHPGYRLSMPEHPVHHMMHHHSSSPRGDDGSRGSGVGAPAALLSSSSTKESIQRYETAIYRCAKERQWQKALRLLKDMQQHGPYPTVRAFTSAISACAKVGQSQKALELLDEMKHMRVMPNVLTYSAAISACEKARKCRQALQLLQEMRENEVEPDVITYNAVISACEKARKWRLALSLMEEMKEKQVRPDVITYSATISACEKGGKLDCALGLLSQLKQDRVKPDVILYNAVISACDKRADFDKARSILNEMKASQVEPDVISYSTAISACDRGNNPKLAFDLLEEMKTQNVEPNSMAFAAAIRAAEKGGESKMDMVKELKDEMKRRNIPYERRSSAEWGKKITGGGLSVEFGTDYERSTGPPSERDNTDEVNGTAGNIPSSLRIGSEQPSFELTC